MNSMISQLKDLENTVINANAFSTTKQSHKSKLVGGTVCKYWIENRCKKGENCEYLHENIKEKLPECQHGMNCTRQYLDCPFKHTRRIIKECVFYDNGYCKEGKNCKSSHKYKDICLNYLIGFCPDGPNCKLFHLKSLILASQDNMNFLSKSNGK